MNSHCPYCRRLVSGEPVVLWDGHAYCRQCVEAVSPALYEFALAGAALRYTVDRDDVRAFRYVAFIGKWFLVVVLLLVGAPFGLLALAGKESVWMLVVALGFFGGFGLVFLTLQGALGAVVLRSRLPRTVSVENGHFKIVTPNDEKQIDLTDCTWYFGSTANDTVCMFTGLRRGVVVQTPGAPIACGHSREMLDHWRAFLFLASVPQNPPLGCLRVLAVAAGGAALGLAVGAGAGQLIASVTKEDIWPWTLGFLGLIEGPIVALMYAGCTFEGVEAARQRFHPAVVALVFFVLGFKVGLIGGFGGALVSAAVNSLLGAAVGWLCRRKIDAARQERALRRQFGLPEYEKMRP